MTLANFRCKAPPIASVLDNPQATFEEALYEDPAVLEAGVIGMPDPVYGEKVIAFVALREGFSASEPELQDVVRSRIADYKTPERILFLPSLPKGVTFKVQRRALRDVYLDVEQQMRRGRCDGFC